MAYNTGLFGETRDGVGAFYFTSVDGTVTSDIFEVSAVFLQPTISVIANDFGHIGSFYFGPVDGTVTSDIFEVSAVFLQPTITVIDRVSGTVISPIFYVNPVFLQPTVYAFKDIAVDYVGVPRAGVSPLTVDFTAIVTLSPAMKGKYKVKEYVWCFDYDYDAGTCKIPWVTTTQNPITHVYTGYRGQKFSAKVCVTLELA